MLSSNHQDIKVAEQILKALHWNYGAQILEAAEVVAHTPGVYPVLITSFKCTPDSYIIEYFKTLLQAYKKPYLILQLDEHDSSVGYETRIEAAIRSFRNHHQINRGKPLTSDYVINSQSIKAVEGLEGKTLFLPNWDRLVGKLMEAILRKEKVDARLLEETEETIQRSLRLNTGQCLPLTAIVQGTIDYINKNNIKPENAAVWCVKSQISCSLGIFPFYIKKILDSYGQGMEKVSVYQGEITFLDFSLKTSMSIYLGYMFAGMLKRMGCKIRPYEKVKGTTDAVIERSLKLFYQMFLHHVMPQEEIVEQVVEMFKSIPVFEEKKVKVAIFGDLYSRDNCTLNQDLIKTIEENGGEVITTAYTDYVKIIGEPYIKKWFSEGLYRHAAMAQLMFLLMPRLEKRYYNYFNQILQEPDYDYSIPYEEILAKLNVKLNHTGESMENILKIFVLKQHYPDLALFVQANPSFCCPSLVTEAMSKRIEELAGIPIVTIEYDGTGGIKNDAIIPYLKFPRKSI